MGEVFRMETVSQERHCCLGLHVGSMVNASGTSLRTEPHTPRIWEWERKGAALCSRLYEYKSLKLVKGVLVQEA